MAEAPPASVYFLKYPNLKYLETLDLRGTAKSLLGVFPRCRSDSLPLFGSDPVSPLFLSLTLVPLTSFTLARVSYVGFFCRHSGPSRVLCSKSQKHFEGFHVFNSDVFLFCLRNKIPKMFMNCAVFHFQLYAVLCKRIV